MENARSYGNASSADFSSRRSGKTVAGFLYSISRQGIGEYWPLHLGQNTIGSSYECDICLRESSVSGKHAVIVIRKMKNSEKTIVSVSDACSANGTMVNGEILESSAMECFNGDIITVGENYELVLLLIDVKALGLKVADSFKFMLSDLPEYDIERVCREASVQLRNDNLVEILGFIGTIDKNIFDETVKRYHVVSKLLEGVMLDELLQGKITDQKGILIPFAKELYHDYQNNPFLFAVTIIRSVLSGVMALHDAGYIHRDINPANIMITRSGHIKLIDFGTAQPLNEQTTICDKALADAFMGKPWYAAPELILGDVKRQNVTTDIYAIGILFFQLYMGRRPFEGDNYEVLGMQLHKRIPLESLLRKDVKAIIAKAINKKQEMRYQSAAEFRVDVDKLGSVSSPSSFSWKYVAIGVGVAAVVLLLIFV